MFRYDVYSVFSKIQESHDHTDLPFVTDLVTRRNLCGNPGLIKMSLKDHKGGELSASQGG